MLLSVTKGGPVFGVGTVVVTHSGKGGRVISDWRTLATGATARPRACVPLKNQHQLRMLCNRGAVMCHGKATPINLVSINHANPGCVQYG